MTEYREFVTVAEAVQLTGKSDKTIRLIIKELLDLGGKSSIPHLDLGGKSSIPHPELLVEVKGDNQRQFYKVSLQYLKKRFDIPTRSEEINTTSTSATLLEVELLHQWIEDKDEIIVDLRKRLDAREVEMLNIQRLLENQQKIALHGQLQIEKAQLSLEERNAPRKKILGLF